MSIPTFDNFTDKYGFGDGKEYSDADERARTRIVRAVNEHLHELDRTDVRLVEFDRNGMHNPCRIVVLPWNGKMSDEELLAKAVTGEIKEIDFSPEDLDNDNWVFSEILDQCYYVERPEIWFGAHVEGSLTYLGVYVNLAPNKEYPVQAFIEHNSLPIRGQKYSVPEHMHLGIEVNEFVNSWLEYANANGYNYGYDPKVIQHEDINSSWELVE